MNRTRFEPISKGGVRRLTQGEIMLAHSLFGYSIQYHKVWVHRASYFPFNAQHENVAMAPNGEIYFQEGLYQDDFSKRDFDEQHLFLHEMAHVWQYQRGMWVKLRGMISWAADYTYSLDKVNLSQYSMEQQASIVSDYWLLLNYGFDQKYKYHKYQNYNESESRSVLISKYQSVLEGFPQ